MSNTIILAGATGNLGHTVANYLIKAGAQVKALVRHDSKSPVGELQILGVEVTKLDFNDHKALVAACRGGSCVVSAVSGLRDVIVDLQTKLLQAVVDAQVPRFIPSDYSIDYTKLRFGSNRNLDLRREFNERLDNAPIAATSVLNGMFTDLLTGQAPIIMQGIKRVMYWGNTDQPLDFTTIDNTAQFTAMAATDTSTPRYLRIAGEVANIKDIQQIASDVYSMPFKLLRPGGLGAFKTLINITRFFAPQKDEVFPAWQGMQYMHNMFTGLPKLNPLNNTRYPLIKWTGIKEVLQKG